MSEEIETRHLAIPRRARYAVLGPEEAPAEAWFGLHGYGQTAPRFLRYLTPLDDGSRLLVAPEGLHRHYLDHEERKVGASWMTSEDRLTDIRDYVGWLDRLHAHLLSDGPDEGGDGPGRIVALGFSQGVHTLARWLAFGAARIDTAVLWGSHLPPDLELDEHGDRLRRARILLVAGDEDPHFTPAAVGRAEARLAEHGIPFETVTFEGGHRLDRDVLHRIAHPVS